jgi:hypothetical protein
VKHLGLSHSLLSDGTAVSQNGIAAARSPPPNNNNTTHQHTAHFHHTHIHPTRIHPLPHSASSSSTNTVHIDLERSLYTNKSHDIEMEHTTSDTASKKRKAKITEAPRAKKLKTGKADKPKRIPKAKEQKSEPVSSSYIMLRNVSHIVAGKA